MQMQKLQHVQMKMKHVHGTITQLALHKTVDSPALQKPIQIATNKEMIKVKWPLNYQMINKLQLMLIVIVLVMLFYQLLCCG